MTRGTRQLACLAIATALCLAVPAAASAAGPFYAEPGGSGSLCTQMSRCSIDTAVSTAAEGEDVLLSPGTYNLSADLNLNGRLSAEIPGSRPTLSSTTGNVLRAQTAGAVVRDIRLVSSGMASATYALNILSGRAERVEVFASGASSVFAASIADGSMISDSVIVADGPFAAAVVSGGTGGTLRNVTAIGRGPDSIGLFTNASYMGLALTETITLQNSIVQGGAYALDIHGDSTHFPTVEADHSNAAPPNSIGLNATVTGTPQTALPLFADSAAGDFHQLSTSPTRDAGAAVAGLSATDLDGQARNQGSAPDIGADEFNLTSVCPCPPVKKKPKCKKKKKKSAASAKKKKCKKKKKKK